MKNPYQILGVAKGAHPDDIKKAYRALARKYHPDARPSDKAAESRFREIADAYDVLGDAAKRKHFDGVKETPTRGKHKSKSRSRKSPEKGGVKSRFDSFFKSRAQKESAGIKTNGADVTYTLEITLKEAALGARKTVRMTGGKALKVKIPPATVTGQTLRLKGQGMAGLGGGKNGDALVEIDVTASETLSRSGLGGLDIQSVEHVPMETAVLGGSLETETISGPVSLSVPKGANTGTQLRLKGRGVRHPDGRVGDHLVTLRVVLPENQDETFRDFIRTWTTSRLRTKESAKKSEKIKAAG